MHRIRTLAVIGVLSLGLVGIALAANPSGPATQPGEHERHPLIHKALHDLREAKHTLTRAAHDFDGHRKAALDATDKAIAECEACLQADQK